MGYYCSVSDFDLKVKDDISEALKDQSEFYLSWRWKDGQLDLDDSYSFKWSENFERDLVILHSLGVRGEIGIADDFEAFTQYKLNGKGVEAYIGSVVFPDVPDRKLEL